MLLLECLRSPLTPRAVRQVVAASKDNLQWAALLEAAEQHHVLPLLAHRLVTGCPDMLPGPVLEHLQSYAVAVSLRNGAMTRELLGVLDVFESAGITAIPFKGPLLAAQLYGDVALRHFGDLDLLVRPRDVQAAKHLLVSRGYRLDPPLDADQTPFVLALHGRPEALYLASRSEHHFVRSSDSMTIDLHSALADPYVRFPLGPDELLERGTWTTLGHTRVRTLSVEDTLLMLSLNGAKDHWQRLQRTCDVSALLLECPDLDQAAVIARARALGALRMLRVSLRLARDLMDTPIPDTLGRDLDGDATADALAREVRAHLAFAPREQPSAVSWGYARAYTRTRERALDRLWFYLYLAFTPGVSDWRAVALPESLRWLYYVARPVRLAWSLGHSRFRRTSASASKSRPASSR